MLSPDFTGVFRRSVPRDREVALTEPLASVYGGERRLCYLDGSYGVSLYHVSVHVGDVVLHHVLVEPVEGVDRPAQQASVTGEGQGS